jgi:hypothetical protein
LAKTADPSAASRLQATQKALFSAVRTLWIGVNTAAFIIGVWLSTLSPLGDEPGPGGILLLFWVFLLFPGNLLMFPALFLALSAAGPATPPAASGVVFFLIWAGGAVLTYCFWFMWVPKRIQAARSKI